MPLEDYALAAGEADNRYKIAKAPPSEIAALDDEAISLRETIRVDATALAHHGYIDAGRPRGKANEPDAPLPTPPDAPAPTPTNGASNAATPAAASGMPGGSPLAG